MNLPQVPVHRSERRYVSLLLVNLFIFGVYTNIFFSITAGIFVPGAWVLISAALMLLHRPECLQKAPIPYLAALLLFALFSTLAGNTGSAYLTERLLTFLIISTALGSTYIAICYLATLEPQLLQRILGGWLVFLTVGCALEVLTPLSALSDGFRQIAYSDRWIYQTNLRDVLTYGAVRPKLFTQEPSHVSKAFMVIGAAWFVLTTNRHRVMWLALCTLILVIFLRSPFVLLALPAAALLEWSTRIAPRLSTNARFTAYVLMLPAIPLAIALLAAAVALIFQSRVELILAGNDFSFFARTIAPFELVGQVWQKYPLFGTGLGAKEALWEEFKIVFGRSTGEGYLYSVYLSHFNNGIANILIYFGLAGSAVFALLTFAYFRSFGRWAAMPMCILTLVLFMLDGGFEGTRMWGYITILLVATLLARWRISQTAAHYAGPASRSSGKNKTGTALPGSRNQQPA